MYMVSVDFVLPALIVDKVSGCTIGEGDDDSRKCTQD